MTTVEQQLADMDRAYQDQRGALLQQIAVNRSAEEAAAAAAAAALGLDRQQKRIDALVSHFGTSILPAHEQRFQSVAARCRDWRAEVNRHVDAIHGLIDVLGDLQLDIYDALQSAVNDAYVRYASEQGMSNDQAWLQAQDLVNSELAGVHDLRTAVAVSVALRRFCDLKVREGQTVVQSAEYGKAPSAMKRLDVTGIADSWIESA